MNIDMSLVQQIERSATNQEVLVSIPGRHTKKRK